MTDDSDSMMRLRLQRVVAYRALCQSVRSSGRWNVVFALLMIFLAYSMLGGRAPGAGGQFGRLELIALLYGGLALAELLVGLFKSVAPSAEGILLDGVVLLLFVGVMLARVAVVGRGGGDVITLIIGVYLGMSALGRFRHYIELRKLFAERPSREQIAWFDDLIREIRAADPQTDDLAIDLPTRPHWKAKLFGTTAFFVGKRTAEVWVAGPGEFDLAREKKDHGTGRRRALLTIHGQHYPEFEITDSSWENYQRWVSQFAIPRGAD